MRIAILVLAAALIKTEPAQAHAPPGIHQVAITFDDLPYVTSAGRNPTNDTRSAIETEHAIVSELDSEHGPATGFVNQDKVQALAGVGTQLIAAWNHNNLELGNHGFNHFDTNILDVARLSVQPRL